MLASTYAASLSLDDSVMRVTLWRMLLSLLNISPVLAFALFCAMAPDVMSAAILFQQDFEPEPGSNQFTLGAFVLTGASAPGNGPNMMAYAVDHEDTAYSYDESQWELTAAAGLILMSFQYCDSIEPQLGRFDFLGSFDAITSLGGLLTLPGIGDVQILDLARDRDPN